MDYALARKELESEIEQIEKLEANIQDQRNSLPPHCSFCGRGKNEVVHMVKGINAYICNDCVDRVKQLMEDSELNEDDPI